MKILSAAVALLLSVSASAAELYGVTMPDTLTLDGKSLALNGLGARKATVFKVKVYVAGLYVEAKSGDGAAILNSPGPKRLDMKFVRDVDAADISKAWSEGLSKKENCGGDCAPFQAKLGLLNASMSDIKKGDTMSFTFRASGVIPEVKGEAKAEIPGADFAKALLSIWLGASPPNSELKKGLLGEKS
jgi:hypothetical protein